MQRHNDECLLSGRVARLLAMRSPLLVAQNESGLNGWITTSGTLVMGRVGIVSMVDSIRE
jgi:hypothetical protein